MTSSRLTLRARFWMVAYRVARFVASLTERLESHCARKLYRSAYCTLLEALDPEDRFPW